MYFRNFLKSIALVGSSAFLLVGCGGGSSSTAPDYNGIFVDAAVEGISWSCGGVSGTTLADGGFGVCPAGSDVTFSIGNVVLGTVAPTADYIFTPQDVVGVPRTDTLNSDVNEMAALLLSLDSDPTTEGITITPEIVTAFNAVIPEGTTTIADLNLDDTVIDELISDIMVEDPTLTDLVAVTTEDAALHLDDTLDDIEAEIIVTPDQPVDDSTN